MDVTSGGSLVVGDIITFGSQTTKYKISNISSNTITFDQLSSVTGSTGLLVAPTNGDNINRTWEFAENFTKAPGL